VRPWLLTFLWTSAVAMHRLNPATWRMSRGGADCKKGEKEQPDAKTRRFRPTRGEALIY